eukprot:maker-scaffold426_size175065-snap-gene-0.40 protein:Tk08643 transcript:maker-scaffold426_size175065-snap-gene-0.40-mRNA-1 annotation:"sodium potassium-transporting atpase subunit beta"
MDQYQTEELLSTSFKDSKTSVNRALLDLVTELRKWLAYALFQLTFIVALTLFFTIYLIMVMHFMDPFQPKVRRGKIAQPGMGFRPKPDNPHSTLIHFQHGSNGNWKYYKESLNEFLKKYGGFGKEVGPSIVCNWNTTLDEVERCHVPFRKYWNPGFDYSCVK